MGFRGGNRGGGRGGGRGGSFRGGNSRGPGRQFDQSPPEEVVELGTFSHECEGQLVVYATIDKIPFFNAPIYLKNITQVGKIDEILGPINGYMVSVQLNDSYKASSFEKGQTLYIDPRKLLPLDRFLPKPPVPKEAKKRKLNDSQSKTDGGSFKKFRDDRGGNRGRGGFSSNRGGFRGDRGEGNRSFGKDSGSFGSNRGRGGFRGGNSRGGSFSRGGRGGGRY